MLSKLTQQGHRTELRKVGRGVELCLLPGFSTLHT